ncbi:MAG: PAS domain S-box protein, partial [Verrucomicrobiota bacterium]
MKSNQNENAKHDKAQTEKTLRASELSYRRLFEAAKDGILILDVGTGCINDVNPFLFNLLGFSRSEMIGKAVGELSPFKDIESNRIMLERLQKEGYVRYEDLPLETQNGRKIAVEFVCNVYQAGESKVIQCNIRDITERKAAEKERLRLAAIIEYSEDAVVSKTANGIIIGWNHGAERLYGYSAEEIIGRSVSILFPPDRYQEYLGIMKEVRNGKPVPPFDTVRRRKDGALINVTVGLTPIETIDSEIIGATKNSHDITRIKNLEAQFIEAQKMEVVGHLASGIAHDFNNILAVILGYSDMILARLGAESPLREYAEEIKHASERATGLTRQLLVFSRKQKVQPVVLDLNGVMKDMEKMLRPLIGENIEMTMVLEKHIWHVKADPGYIGQVLMNLAINARDAMPDGGKLTIETSNVTLDAAHALHQSDAAFGEYVMLSVKDTGVGMTHGVKAHLFEAFFTTKALGRGTGLGLATCRTIIEECKGHIEYFSEVGEGTTFKIYFPGVNQPLDAAVTQISSGPLPRGTETLLVVEDEPSVRCLARDILKAQGYEVLSASNGQEGLHAAFKHKGTPIRLVITDVIMPVLGGKAMAEWLKTSYPDLKILFTSGYPDDVMTHHGALDVDVEYLGKPYSPATLVRKVRELLDQKTGSANLRKHEMTSNHLAPGST